MFSQFRCRQKYSGLDGNRQFFSVSRSSARQTFAAALVSAPSARLAGGVGDGRKIVCNTNSINIVKITLNQKSPTSVCLQQGGGAFLYSKIVYRAGKKNGV